MKKKIIAFLSLLFLIVACKPAAQEHPSVLDIDATTVMFGQDSESKSISVNASGAWTASVEAGNDWLSVKPDGDKKLTLSVTANDSQKARSATVTIALTGSSLTKSIKVTQEVSEKITVEKSEYSIDSNGGEISVTVNATSPDWKPTLLTPSASSWLSFTPMTDQGILKVKVEAIQTDEAIRQAQIIIQLGEERALINIKQTGRKAFPTVLVKYNATRKEVKQFMAQHQDESTLSGKTANNPNGNGPQTLEQYTGDLLYESKTVEGKYIIYGFETAKKGSSADPRDDDPLKYIYIIGQKNEKNKEKEFTEGVLEQYLTSEGYTSDEVEPSAWTKKVDGFLIEAGIYKAGLGLNALFLPTTGVGGVMKINMLSLDPDDKNSVFPIRKLDLFRSTGYMLDQVKAYEQSQGLQPNETAVPGDSDDKAPYTQKSKIPGYEKYYESYYFQSTKELSKLSAGELYASLYYFCIPGLTNEFGKDEHGAYKNLEWNFPEKPELAGTVGKRIDIYKGYSRFCTKLPNGGFKLIRRIENGFKALNFEMGRNSLDDTDLPMVGLYRGNDEVIFIQVSESFTYVTYMKSSILVDITKKEKK